MNDQAMLARVVAGSTSKSDTSDANDTENQYDSLADRKRLTGDYSLRDLPFNPPPDLLAEPFLDPEGPTVNYSPGGNGKGLSAVALIKTSLGDPRIDRIGVLDYENHEREWGWRSRAMGFSSSELDRVKYLAPYGQKWGENMGDRGPLIKVADEVRAWCDALGISYLIVDSYTAATTSSDALGGERSATEYFTALQHVGRASLTLAHVAASAERFPPKPFGSVFVHNWARRTWALAADQDESQLRVEFRNMKANNGKRGRPMEAVFVFNSNGTISYRFGAVILKLADAFAEILKEAKGAISTKAIAGHHYERTSTKVTPDAVYQTLARDKRFVREGIGLWGLAVTTRETSPTTAHEQADEPAVRQG